MRMISKYSWLVFLFVGLGLIFFAYDNLVTIQGLAATDPNRGWAWLTTDPEIISYIKFWFRNFGIWVLAVAILVILIAVTGYREKEKWAWVALAYIPVHIGIHMIIWPWLNPGLAIVLLLTVVALAAPFREFFPRTG